MAALGYGLLAVAVLGVLLLILFLIAPDRMKDFFGTIAMFARSLAESKAEAKGVRKHKRRSDPPAAPEHEHVRKRSTPRPSMLMTIRGWATPPRDSGPRRRHDDEGTDQ